MRICNDIIWQSFHVLETNSVQEIKYNRAIQYLAEELWLQAARDDLLEIVTEHLKWQTCNLNETDEDGLTALHHAARYNRINCVKVLLDAGAGIVSQPHIILVQNMYTIRIRNNFFIAF